MKQFLLQLYKSTMSGFGFILFGIGGILFAYILFPLIKLIYRDKSKYQPKLRLCVHYAFRSLMYFLHYTRTINFNIIGKEDIDLDKSCLVVANHPCLIDVVAIIGVYKNACCIVKNKLWDNIFCKGVLQGVGYIPNSEDPEKMIALCQNSLANGDVLIIFPEGTRTQKGKDLVLQRGAARIAYILKCPIRVLRLDVGGNFLTKSVAWYSIPTERVRFTLSVHSLIDQEFILSHSRASIAARRITAEIAKRIDFKN